MTAEQIPFEFAPNEEASLIEGSANETARALIDRLPTRLAIVGAQGAGKTSLLARLNGVRLDKATLDDAMIAADARFIIDDVDRALENWLGEDQLFHLYNRAHNEGGLLALSTQTPLGALAIKLPDLRSRLATIEQAEIGAPDDDMVAALLAKGFHARGVLVSPELITYLARRVERDYAAIADMVVALDHRARVGNVKVTRQLARAILEGDE